MTNTVVNIGCTYEVAETLVMNKMKVEKGTRLFAWFCGQLIFVTLTEQETLNHAFEYAPTVKRTVKLIDEGKLLPVHEVRQK